ncbi:nuclear transport factor 2 family protein [Plantactinospora solaniradicis]|uniref:Nuclear transport factor 2 family protein n=1 Tax=Plantactinospora solaniradicis TaxID=1723736 RepID=A0ABW1KNY6_9ACTN
MTEAMARAHIDRFNAAVASGDWSWLTASLHPDAVMTFVGPPVGPFVGRDAIAQAYATNPPDDTMRILAVRTDAEAEVVSFEWSRGGTGTLTIHRNADQITSLAIEFD